MANPGSGRQWQEGLSTLSHDNLAAEEAARQHAAKQQQTTQMFQNQMSVPPAYTLPQQPAPATPPGKDLEATVAAAKRRLAVAATVAIVTIAVSVVGFVILTRG